MLTPSQPNFRPGSASGSRFARALATRPRLLLADEPTANLDAVWAKRVIELLRRAAQAGATVVVATHDCDLAAGTGARVLTLRGGRLVREQRKLHPVIRVA